MEQKPKQKRGFAAMSKEKQREIASMGDRSVAPEARSFSQSRALAATAGSKGGKATGPSKNRHSARGK